MGKGRGKEREMTKSYCWCYLHLKFHSHEIVFKIVLRNSLIYLWLKDYQIVELSEAVCYFSFY